MRSVYWCLSRFPVSAGVRAGSPMHLTLAEAQRLAIQNNPQFTAAKFTAAAADQVPAEYHAAYEPTLFGSLTGVGADNGSRLAAGGLNNPVVYNRLGSGLIGQPDDHGFRPHRQSGGIGQAARAGAGPGDRDHPRADPAGREPRLFRACCARRPCCRWRSRRWRRGSWWRTRWPRWRKAN